MLGPRYDVPPKQLAQARASALHDARPQARALADAAGAQVGAVLRIENQDAWAESSGAYVYAHKLGRSLDSGRQRPPLNSGRRGSGSLTTAYASRSARPVECAALPAASALP